MWLPRLLASSWPLLAMFSLISNMRRLDLEKGRDSQTSLNHNCKFETDLGQIKSGFLSSTTLLQCPHAPSQAGHFSSPSSSFPLLPLQCLISSHTTPIPSSALPSHPLLLNTLQLPISSFHLPNPKLGHLLFFTQLFLLNNTPSSYVISSFTPSHQPLSSSSSTLPPQQHFLQCLISSFTLVPIPSSATSPLLTQLFLLNNTSLERLISSSTTQSQARPSSSLTQLFLLNNTSSESTNSSFTKDTSGSSKEVHWQELGTSTSKDLSLCA